MVLTRKKYLEILDGADYMKWSTISEWLDQNDYDEEAIFDVLMTVNHDYNIEMYWIAYENDSKVTLIATANHTFDTGECVIKLQVVHQDFTREQFERLSVTRN